MIDRYHPRFPSLVHICLVQFSPRELQSIAFIGTTGDVALKSLASFIAHFVGPKIPQIFKSIIIFESVLPQR